MEVLNISNKELLINEEIRDKEIRVIGATGEQLGIMQAPTLVVIKDGQVKKIANASNIRKYAETIA